MLMAEAADRAQWSHTSHILATLKNANPFYGGESVAPASMNPYMASEQAEIEKSCRVTLKGSDIALRYGR